MRSSFARRAMSPPPSIDERAQPRERSDFADNRPGAARPRPAPSSMGGGFIEFLFTGRSEMPRTQYQRPWEDMAERDGGRVLNVRRDDPAAPDDRRAR